MRQKKVPNLKALSNKPWSFGLLHDIGAETTDILMLGREHGYQPLRQAVENAVEMGRCDVVLAAKGKKTEPRRSAEVVGISALSGLRPVPTHNGKLRSVIADVAFAEPHAWAISPLHRVEPRHRHWDE